MKLVSVGSCNIVAPCETCTKLAKKRVLFEHLENYYIMHLCMEHYNHSDIKYAKDRLMKRAVKKSK